jgi:small subunit ribosomal protein S4
VARYRGPVGKVSRRLGFGISEKGARILEKRPTPPGMHGAGGGANNRNKKASDYSLRLAEKQKARYTYGMLEKQFRRTFEQARRETGETGGHFFSLLERRLDNTVYRLGLAKTRQQARQIVTHGHIMVNGRKTNIASYSVKVGEQITVRPQSRNRPYFKDLTENGQPNRRVPAWLRFDVGQMAGEVIAVPTRTDAEPDINEQLIVEYYSR